MADVLSLLKPRTCMAGGFDIGNPLSLQFGPYDGIKCYAVVSGECWLDVEGVSEPMQLTEGDCFLLTQSKPFRLASDLAVTPVDAHALLTATRRQGGIASLEGGGQCCLVGGYFAFESHHAGLLLGMLPPVVHLRKESDKAALRWSLEQMRQELLYPQPGGSLIAHHLAHMMLVQALRLHLAEGMQGGVGWLFALADPQMSVAMTAMHESPGHRWTLQELGQLVGMSRSVFALKFKQTVGTSPMEYLTRWRMLQAGDRLENSGDPLSVISLSLGYDSESAFSTAFKRIMGCSPRRYSGHPRSAPPLTLVEPVHKP